LTIEFTAGEPVEVQFFTVSTGIGRKESKFQVTKRREIYTLEGRFFSEFLQPAVYFRDRRPLSQMALTSVKWFCLERGERAIFTARRNDEGWNLSAGFGSAPEVTGKPVQTTLLHTLSELRALAYYDASAALSGVENTEPLHLRLQGESAQVVVTLLRPLSSENQEDVPWFVRVKGGEELTAVIPGAAIEQLKKELTTLEGLLPAQ
jgi:hypothetical protein